MLDVKVIRDNPDAVRQGLSKRVGKFPLDEILALEKSRRELLIGVEGDRHQLKEESEAFGASPNVQPARKRHRMK